MATPTLRAVRRHFRPPARIVGILPHTWPNCSTAAIGSMSSFPSIPSRIMAEHGRLALIARMRRQRFDIALLLTNSLHTAALAWLGGARRRVGYARDGRSFLLTKPIPAARDGRQFRPMPMVESYLALARAIDCPEESPQLELNVTAAEGAEAERAWHDLGLRTDGRVVAMNSTGAYGAAKLWPAEHCAALARQIVDRLDHDVLVFCGPGERDAARQIATLAGSSRVFSLAAQAVSLGLTKGCLDRCRLMVSTDSGPRHIAAALGKPVVTFLGPTLPAWIENPSVRGSILRGDLECLGCGKRTCPAGHHRCMRDLTPERVLREVASLVQTTAIKAA